MRIYSACVLSIALSAGLAISTTASAATDPALALHLQKEEAAMRGERAAYVGYFRQAYARYPSIPAGTLEALAYVQSRWHHLRPAAGATQENHHHMPSAYGVMGLYRGQGFADQVDEAASLLGLPASRVAQDPSTNIVAAAALLDREIARSGLGKAPTAEQLAPVLARYAGFAGVGARSGSAVDDYARSSFAYDVLLAQDKGVNDRGIVVPARAIAWEQAFTPQQLVAQRAPFVRLDVTADRVEAAGLAIDPVSETLNYLPGAKQGLDNSMLGSEKSPDYGPALWVASPYHSARTSYDAVTIHTAQGSYAGTISWFQNNPNSVSAHYVIRSSDGQVTQMVRDNRAAHHVRSHNPTTLGIEHEGFVDNSSWYTTAMYNSSAALVRNFCGKYSAITCASAYNGASHSGVVVLATSVKIKGHQHFSGQTHTDPGINWDWRRYYTLLNPGGGGGAILDSFESSVGHFDTAPAYSGSTTGIAATSLSERNCTIRRNGNCSLRLLLKDDPVVATAWAVRQLSGSGNPASNAALTRAGGKVGFWVYTGASGVSAAVGIDDSDGTERSVSRAIPVDQWTYVEWALEDANQWEAWVGGANGAITASSVKLDAVWFYRDQTSFDVNLYVDDVQIKN